MTQLRDRLVKRIAAAIDPVQEGRPSPSAIADGVLQVLAAEGWIGPDHPRAAQIAELLRFPDHA